MIEGCVLRYARITDFSSKTIFLDSSRIGFRGESKNWVVVDQAEQPERDRVDGRLESFEKDEEDEEWRNRKICDPELVMNGMMTAKSESHFGLRM